jgi:hypothetical protein
VPLSSEKKEEEKWNPPSRVRRLPRERVSLRYPEFLKITLKNHEQFVKFPQGGTFSFL